MTNNNPGQRTPLALLEERPFKLDILFDDEETFNEYRNNIKACTVMNSGACRVHEEELQIRCYFSTYENYNGFLDNIGLLRIPNIVVKMGNRVLYQDGCLSKRSTARRTIERTLPVLSI